ncbi:hypothetical protein E1218_10565 [Kribbella turkmenica]|uniref:UDP-N-acetylglucosamine kinase n=1 Tax=Kribbella turkmenica TaxID=2530375 RepID=A0A4R4XA43_9ACTN|nr:zeta toxin family protein [Kribbella turkmenica]TDD27421.1 hypothetical protein E1218_10565 [Kribbella turkmenica]
MSRLPNEQLQDVYLRRIRRGILKHRRPMLRRPTVLFIAGQPGAGKTTMQAAAIERLGMKTAYVLDHDELLDKHPGYASGALENDYTAAAVYGQDAAIWRGWALQDVQARQLDVVVPFPISGQYDLDLMKQFQDKGYRVEVAFAAVHEAQSQLGIMERFVDGRQESGYGRWIGAGQHDQIYRDMLGTAEAIEAHRLADAVHVYRRGEAEPVFTNERKNGLWRHPPGSSRAAIEAERNRPWTDREVNHFHRGWNRLAALADRPIKDHFKAMPLMASDEGRRLLGRLQQLAAPKLAEHRRFAEQRGAPASTRQATGPELQQPTHPGHQPPIPQPSAQQFPPRPQFAPTVHLTQQQEGAGHDQAGRREHDWQQFGVRLQAEQTPASAITAPGAGAHPQPEADAAQPAQRYHRGPSAGPARGEHGPGESARDSR